MVSVEAQAQEHVCAFLPDYSLQIPPDTHGEDWGEKNMKVAPKSEFRTYFVPNYCSLLPNFLHIGSHKVMNNVVNEVARYR